MMSWLHTHFFLPLADPDRCSGLPRRLRAIRRFERLPEKAQRAEQQLRLQRLLQHAYDTVPYYKRLFDAAGFLPPDARVDRPLPLPVLTPEQVRLSSGSLLSNAYKPSSLRAAVSRKTVGTPMRFHRDANGVRDKVALKLKMDTWAGFHTGDSVMMLWGAHCALSRESNWRWRMPEGVFMRQNPVPEGPLGNDVLDRMRWRYERQRPKVLYGRSSVLTAFANYLSGRGIRHRPQTVITTADVLSMKDRRLLASVFKTVPYVYYGSRDVGMIGAECSEHEGMHFHPWGSYVEFNPIGTSRYGTVYRLLVTDLLNYGQPFIRYDTQDCVTLSPQSCSCGRWFPLVDQVLGHLVDGAVYANGEVVSDVVLDEAIQEPEPLWPAMKLERIPRPNMETLRGGRRWKERNRTA